MGDQTALALRSDGSVTMQSDGSVALVDPDSGDCCCGGCASDLPCESCGDAQTPLTMAFTIPALTPRSGLQTDPLGVYGEYEVFGTFPGLTLCLAQDTANPCLWGGADGPPFDTLYVTATSTETITTDKISGTILVAPGPMWRGYAYLYGPESGSPNPDQFLIYDTGWVSGTPPCGGPQTAPGLPPLSDPFEQPADHPQRVWVVTDTGDMTATPCCEVEI